jgi:nucleotide sugar dehydrogenase
VGLPLVRACVNFGHEVVGIDIDTEKVESLSSCRSYVDDVTDDELGDWLARGFSPQTSVEGLQGTDVFVICVPTPLTKAGGPDLGPVEAACRTISAALGGASPNCLVVLESTTYPGTTDEVVRPILEESGLVAGEDFSLAFSPERIDPGNSVWTFENTPKVVGGLTSACADHAVDFYAGLTSQVVRTKGLKEAEMAKLLENTYRHVNIALVNELARLSHKLGIDIWDVISAAETKPYGFQAFRPGPGVGGHCIPIDPNYLSHRVRSELGQPFRFVELAQEINASMPQYVVQRLQEALNRVGHHLKGTTVCLLGVAYKPDIADLRDSPAFDIARELRASGADVAYVDPYAPSFVVDGISVTSWEGPHPQGVGAVGLLLQAHTSSLAAWNPTEWLLFFDCRAVIDQQQGTTRL